MQLKVLHPVGVEISDLSLTDITVATRVELQRLLADHGVAVLPGHVIDDAGFLAFLKEFGDLAFSEGEICARHQGTTYDGEPSPS